MGIEFIPLRWLLFFGAIFVTSLFQFFVKWTTSNSIHVFSHGVLVWVGASYVASTLLIQCVQRRAFRSVIVCTVPCFNERGTSLMFGELNDALAVIVQPPKGHVKYSDGSSLLLEYDQILIVGTAKASNLGPHVNIRIFFQNGFLLSKRVRQTNENEGCRKFDLPIAIFGSVHFGCIIHP
jgi:hypothetical protein